jgi:primary-amine oxidase
MKRLVFAALALLVGTSPGMATPTHPLDPLEAGELKLCKATLEASGQLPEDALYPWVQLEEPSKAEVQGFSPGKPFSRRAYLVAVSQKRKTSYECVVDLKARKLVSRRDLKQLQPMLAYSEFDRAAATVDADPRIKIALQKRGYTVAGKVSDSFLIDTYAPGEDDWLKANPGRYIRVLFSDKRGGTNIYGPVVEGLMAYVDLNADKVVRIVDYPGYSGATAPHDIFSPRVRGPKRGGLKPMTVAMPKGASYALQGNRVLWQGFDFRFSFNLREGLVIHQLGFRDPQTKAMRPILYRGSVSEMLVPYAESAPQWLWREFFDSGEYGLGLNSTDVRPGKELPENAQVLDAVLPDEALKGSTYNDRIFLYERDGGPLVFHKQWSDNNRVYARGRELVIGFVATVGNYDYFYTWIFKQDGSFQFAVDLEGEILNKSVQGIECDVCRVGANVGPGQTYEAIGYDQFGTLVAPNLLGVHHQHWVNLRLDFDVDGTSNAVKECNTRALPYSATNNARGRAYTVTHHVFDSEQNAARNVSPLTNRNWVVYNPNLKSPLGHVPGYEIDPQSNTATSIPTARAKQPAGFINHHFWATQYKAQEMYAAGAFPNQAPEGTTDSLPHYAGSESVYQQDVVLWYNLGYTHITKPEDYPIMPRGHMAVDFRPKGFFNRSPVLDLLTVEMAPPEDEDEVKPAPEAKPN